MKQFNLEEYKKNPNRRVITRDGKSVRIVCTDVMGAIYPVLAVYKKDPTHEVWNSYTTDGRLYTGGGDTQADLFFAPEKHIAWTNIYKSESGVYANSGLYNSEEEALANSYALKIATCKIEWEE